MKFAESTFVSIFVVISVLGYDESNTAGDEESMFNFVSTKCVVPEWNKITSRSLPFDSIHKKWLINGNLTCEPKYSLRSSPSPFSAFVFKTHISVVLSSDTTIGKKVYCRYFDCNHREYRAPYQKSIVFPENTVYCPRVQGAEFISVTLKRWGPTEPPVRLVPRLENERYFSVCVSPIFGDEPKFSQIADFIENWRFQGASFFHFYIRNISDYDRILLDDYIRTGEVEVIKLHDSYWKDDFMWQNVQIADCFQRSKKFAKWTTFVDLNDRIEIYNESYKTLGKYLDSINDPNLVNLQFSSLIVETPILVKPTEFNSENEIRRTLTAVNASEQPNKTFSRPINVFRAEKVAAVDSKCPILTYSGDNGTVVDENIGVIVHRIVGSGKSGQLGFALSKQRQLGGAT